MIRTVIKPVDNSYTLTLPDEMVGKTVEVIAFEIEPEALAFTKTNSFQTLERISETYSKYPIISHDNFRFNREDANDYE